MSYGLPVVVSAEKYCGIAGLLTDEVNALMLDNPQDASILTQYLQAILDNTQLQENLHSEALKFTDHYAWQRIAHSA